MEFWSLEFRRSILRHTSKGEIWDREWKKKWEIYKLNVWQNSILSKHWLCSWLNATHKCIRVTRFSIKKFILFFLASSVSVCEYFDRVLLLFFLYHILSAKKSSMLSYSVRSIQEFFSLNFYLKGVNFSLFCAKREFYFWSKNFFYLLN